MSAERWIGSRQRWSGMRARPSQLRQKRVVAAIRASASSTSAGTASSFGPGESAVGSRPLEAHAVPDAVPLDPEREVGLEADRLPCPGRVRRVAAAVDERPLRRLPAVVEDGLADELDLDGAVEALDRPHEHVVGVVVGGRPRVRCDLVLVLVRAHRQRVADDDPAGRRLPRRHEDVRARARTHVRSGWLMPNGAEPEVPGPAIEQAAEHARRVEARDAEPVDRAVGRDERARVAVGEERVVRDRRERRRSGGALRRRLGRVRRRSLMTRSTARASGRAPRRARRPRRAPGSRRVDVDRRRRVEQRLHDPPRLLDAVLAREPRASRRPSRRGAAPRTASRPRRPLGELDVEQDRRRGRPRRLDARRGRSGRRSRDRA